MTLQALGKHYKNKEIRNFCHEENRQPVVWLCDSVYQKKET